MNSKLTLQNILTPRYTVSVKGSVVTFLWSAASQENLESSIDLRIKTKPEELYSLSRNLGCINEQGKIIFPDFDSYNRLLIYACVRPLMRKPEKIDELAQLVFEINSLDALYWASRFREVWWKHAKYRKILKVAKAFKLFFNLE
ncbi:MAG: hypothetical protein JTT17_06065 [Candidatus Brockarchaeota archaeon]|nr:hypothetical protein [Candidatus Brockarchaeota archaeon]